KCELTGQHALAYGCNPPSDTSHLPLTCGFVSSAATKSGEAAGHSHGGSTPPPSRPQSPCKSCSHDEHDHDSARTRDGSGSAPDTWVWAEMSVGSSSFAAGEPWDVGTPLADRSRHSLFRYLTADESADYVAIMDLFSATLLTDLSAADVAAELAKRGLTM